MGIMTQVTSQVIGYIAGALTTLCVLPQIVHAIRTRSTRDLSYMFIVTLITGLALWLTYGILIEQVPVIVPNAVSIGLNAILLVVKLHQDYISKTQSQLSQYPKQPVP